MRNRIPLPQPFIFPVFIIAVLLTGQPLQLFGQRDKRSKKEIRTTRIDSIFASAEKTGLDTKGVLRYTFYFDDPSEKRLTAFAARMAYDTFEMASLLKKEK